MVVPIPHAELVKESTMAKYIIAATYMNQPPSTYECEAFNDATNHFIKLITGLTTTAAWIDSVAGVRLAEWCRVNE